MCVFCEIIKGNIPSKKIYETEDVLAILDISQATPGHTLVMPKVHYDNLYEIDPIILNEVIRATQKIAMHYKNVDRNIIGINLLNNNEPGAGQSVMHYHMHILPRFKTDNLEIKFTDNSGNTDLAYLQRKYQ